MAQTGNRLTASLARKGTCNRNKFLVKPREKSAVGKLNGKSGLDDVPMLFRKPSMGTHVVTLD